MLWSSLSVFIYFCFYYLCLKSEFAFEFNSNLKSSCLSELLYSSDPRVCWGASASLGLQVVCNFFSSQDFCLFSKFLLFLFCALTYFIVFDCVCLCVCVWVSWNLGKKISVQCAVATYPSRLDKFNHCFYLVILA